MMQSDTEKEYEGHRWMFNESADQSDNQNSLFVPLKHRLYHLSIREAAELVAVDMWVSGVFPEIEEPDEWSGSDRDPALRGPLSEKIKELESRILQAVDSGRLKARNLIRNFDEKLDKSQPRIRFRDLESWLNERGYSAGETFSEWIESEAEIEARLEGEFEYLRALAREGSMNELPYVSDGIARLHEVDSMERANLISVCKTLVIENDRFRQVVYDTCPAPAKVHDAKIDRPLTTRQRRTFLTVIAAMCKYEGLDPHGRGTAQRITEMTDDLGAHVDDGTIAKILSEIPDALETRMK